MLTIPQNLISPLIFSKLIPVGISRHQNPHPHRKPHWIFFIQMSRKKNIPQYFFKLFTILLCIKNGTHEKNILFLFRCNLANFDFWYRVQKYKTIYYELSM